MKLIEVRLRGVVIWINCDVVMVEESCEVVFQINCSGNLNQWKCDNCY